jgi:hypothetical protein
MLYTAPQRDNYTRLSRVARRERLLGHRGTPKKDRSNAASTGQQPLETPTLGYHLN